MILLQQITFLLNKHYSHVKHYLTILCESIELRNFKVEQNVNAYVFVLNKSTHKMVHNVLITLTD